MCNFFSFNFHWGEKQNLPPCCKAGTCTQKQGVSAGLIILGGGEALGALPLWVETACLGSAGRGLNETSCRPKWSHWLSQMEAGFNKNAAFTFKISTKAELAAECNLNDMHHGQRKNHE